MTLVHLVTSVLVGGQTGKTTHSLMLTSYLSSSSSSSKVNAFIDLSNNAVTYAYLYNLFGKPRQGRIAGHPCFIVKDDRDKRLYIIKPRNYLDDRDQIIQFFNLIRSTLEDLPEVDSVDHIICETNLPNEALNSSGFLDDFRGVSRAAVPLFIWTTWITLSLTDQQQHDNYYTMIRWTDDTRIFYVHNPFPSAVGSPNGTHSPSILQCYNLPTGEDYSPLEMWSQCGALVGRVHPTEEGEGIWERAYSEFIRQEQRPANLLPVFINSQNWKNVYLSHFERETIGDLSELSTYIDRVSDKLYSLVYKPYFAHLSL